MSTAMIPLRFALGVTNRMAVCIDSPDMMYNLLEHMVQNPLRCDDELRQALELSRERLIEVYPWMEKAVLPESIMNRPGGSYAFFDHYECKHGAEIAVPLVESGKFLPHEHAPRKEVFILGPNGPIPFSELPEEFKQHLREMGIDGE